MNDCRRFSRWISRYWDRELESRKHALLMRHLSTCVDCRLRFSEAERLSAALDQAFDLRIEPPDALADRVMASLKREPFRPTPISAFSKILRFRPARRLAAPIAGLLALSAGYWRTRPIETIAPAHNARAIADLGSSRSFAKPFDPARAETVSNRSEAPTRALSRERMVISKPVKDEKPSRTLDPASSFFTSVFSPAPTRKTEPESKRRARSSHRGSAAISRHHDASPPAIVATKSEADDALADASPRLQRVSGSALVRSDDTDWSQAIPDATVRLDQRLRSGRDSQALLTLGKIELRMNAETEMIPIRAPGPESPYWVVRLVHGELFIKAPKGESGLKTLTPAGDVTSKEGEYIVRADDLFETRLMIAKGSATLENDLGRSFGARNMQIASRLGCAPELAQPILDSDAFRWAYAPFQFQDLLLRQKEP